MFNVQSFFRHEVGLVALLGMLFDEIGEEEKFQHQEYDDELDDDNRPKRSSQRHVAEAIVVKVENPVE
jgi:hypothetical protein